MAKATAKKKAAKSKTTRGRKTAVKRTARTKKTSARASARRIPIGPERYSAKDLEQFRQMILEKKKETMEELEALKESMMDVTTGEYISESSTYSMHMEQGTDAMEREKTFLFASRSSKFLNQLDDALKRIEDGTYGVCRVCQLLIPKERLEAVPTAQTCAEYKNTGMPCERGRLALAKMKKH